MLTLIFFWPFYTKKLPMMGDFSWLLLVSYSLNVSAVQIVAMVTERRVLEKLSWRHSVTSRDSVDCDVKEWRTRDCRLPVDIV